MLDSVLNNKYKASVTLLVAPFTVGSKEDVVTNWNFPLLADGTR